MSAKSATLAKSLHTVSAIVSVARHLMAVQYPLARDAAGAVRTALDILGYDGAADPYGLAARAVATLEKGAR